MHIRSLTFVAAGGVLLAALVAAPPQPADHEHPLRILMDDFEQKPTDEGLPPGWEQIFFESIPRHTTYQVRKEDDNSYLHAEADRSASGLARKMAFDLKDYPIVKWRWRIGHVVKDGDARRKSGDDCAARLYISFKYDPSRVGYLTRIRYALAKRKLGRYPPLYVLSYIWANKLERGAIVANAYSAQTMMVAVESGDARAGRWLSEERNAYEDFKRAFAVEPTEVIGVALMTDTDNTESWASADYDDIVIERAPATGPLAGSSLPQRRGGSPARRRLPSLVSTGPPARRRPG